MGNYFIDLYLLIALLILQASSIDGKRLHKRSSLDTLYAELSVVEEQSVDSFSENLDVVARQALERAHIQWEDLRPIQITLLETNPYFQICPNEALNVSFLCLKKRIDREILCPTEGICCPRFQQSGKSFDSLPTSSGETRPDDCAISLILMVDFSSIFDNSRQQRLLSLSVRVVDINDHAPAWKLQRSQNQMNQHSSDSSHYNSGIPVLNLPIRENAKIGTKIELPEALDPDAYPENTTVNYGIDSDVSGLFSLEWTGRSRAESNFLELRTTQDKLWLVLNKELDRDEQKTHQVKIFAVDGGAVKPQTGYLILNITVEDVNNHSPKFEKHDYFVWVLEHSPIGSVICRLKASDQDESDADKLEYSLASSVTPQTASLFVVDKRTGEIRVQGELDYEKVTSYSLSVTVTDGLHFDDAVIIIGILNINDHPPVITLHSYLATTSRYHLFDAQQRVSGSQLTIEVRENGPPVQLIATFTVTDGDDSAEARFLQTASPVRDAFLLAMDIGLQEASERIKKPPQCKLNTDLMEIELLNLDSRSHKARFQIRLAKKSFDREVSAKHLIRIECWDRANQFGNHILTQSNMVGYRSSFSRSTNAIFTVVVLDENDSVPQFIGPLVGTIAEGQPVGTLINKITATDADDPYSMNGLAGLQYSIIGEPEVTYAPRSSSSNMTSTADSIDASSWFTLDPRSGELRSAVVFDREVVASFNLTVRVSDGGDDANSSIKHNSAFKTMQITVSDVNDCQPVFDKLVYQFNISEGATPPLHIGTIQANDCDADEINRRLYYWLQQQPTNSTSAGRWFTVSRSGELYLGSKGASDGKVHDWRPLDREKEELIVFEVLARDHGQPSLTGSAQVIIRLQDVNDNSPIWNFPKPSDRVINISLDASVGQRIVELNATDSDEGDFGKVTYSIISGNEEGHFELDELTGSLYISKPFTAATGSSNSDQDDTSTTSANTNNILLQNRLRMLSYKTFRLYLKASDQGDPPRTTTAVLDIRLSGPSVPSFLPKPASILSKSDVTSGHQSATNREEKTSKNRSNQPSYPPGSKHQQYLQQQDQDNLISTESLIIIAVMVAAVAALLFIVVLLATACLRKRILTVQSRQQCPGGGKSTSKNAEFELQFAGDDGSANGGAPEMIKKIYGVPTQPPSFIDSASTYVTVTRNTLKRDHGIPNDMTTTYTVQSFDNLDTIQGDMLCPYRFEKMSAGQPTAIFMQPPSSSLLAMDPRIAQSGTTEESVNHSESSLHGKEKMYAMENAPRTACSTTYTLAGKQPVIYSPGTTLSRTVSPQTMPRNHSQGIAYVALTPTTVGYTTEGMHAPDGLFFSGGKCLSYNKQMSIPNCAPQSPSATSPFLLKFAKPSGYILDSDGSRTTTYTPLNFTMSGNDQNQQYQASQQQQQVSKALGDESGSNNQESSFV